MRAKKRKVVVEIRASDGCCDMDCEWLIPYSCELFDEELFGEEWKKGRSDYGRCKACLRAEIKKEDK